MQTVWFVENTSLCSWFPSYCPTTPIDNDINITVPVNGSSLHQQQKQRVKSITQTRHKSWYSFRLNIPHSTSLSSVIFYDQSQPSSSSEPTYWTWHPTVSAGVLGGSIGLHFLLDWKPIANHSITTKVAHFSLNLRIQVLTSHNWRIPLKLSH